MLGTACDPSPEAEQGIGRSTRCRTDPTVTGRMCWPKVFASASQMGITGYRVSDNREQGVSFGDLWNDLQDEEYPVSKSGLLAEYGDQTIQHADGGSTLSSLLDPMGITQFDSAQEVRQSILTMVKEGAEGRTDYSDRGTAEAEETRDQESF